MNESPKKSKGIISAAIDGVKAAASFVFTRGTKQTIYKIDSYGGKASDGVTFGSDGLTLYEAKRDTRGELVRDEKGKIQMVTADITKLARRIKSKGAGSSFGSQDSLAMWKPGASPRVNASLAMENYTGLNFATISALADEMSGIVWELYQIDAKGNHNQKFDHEILDLLDGVNEFQTGPELKFMIAAHLELTGNAYLLLLNKKGKPVGSDSEKPAQIHTLDPGKVVVKIDKSTYPYRIAGYLFKIDGREFNYETFQIVQIKRPNPSNPLVGVGTTQAIADWIDVDNYAMEFNRQFFLHGTYLTGTIESEATTEDQIDSLRETWNEQHTGVQNANKVAIMPKGVKFNPGLQPKDMAFDKMLDKTADRIHAGTRVSSTILGTAEADTNRATAETADYVFAKRLVKPRMQMICSYINELLVSRWGDNLYISFTDPTPEDKAFRITEMQAVSASQQVMTVNETREKYFGLGPIEGGDVLFRSNTMVPIDQPVEADGSGDANPAEPQRPDNAEEAKPQAGDDDNENKPKEPKKTLAYRPTRVRFARNRHVRQDAAKALVEAIIDAVKTIKEQKSWRLSSADYAILAKESEDRSAEARKALEKITIKFHGEQQKTVIENLTKIAKAVDPTDIFDIKDWTAILVDLTTPTLTALAKSEGEKAAEAITGVGIDVTANPTYASALGEAINLLGQKYNQTTLDDLKETIEENLAKGGSIADLETAVRGYYSEANQYRAPMLARTETFRVANSATKAAWQQTGVVKSMKWYTSQHDNVCPFCQSMDGKIVGINDNFFSKGDTLTVGDQSMSLDYDDVGAPPLHPNCGCYLQPEDVSVD